MAEAPSLGNRQRGKITVGSWFGWVLRFRFLVLAIAAGTMAVGIVHLRDARVDVLPEFTPTYAEVQTEALGLSAEEVEQLVTVPLEADLLNGVEGVDVIRSESVPGMSSIVMVFEQGTDVYRARQLVEERLTQAHALPNVSKPPALLPPLSSSSRVLMIGLSTKEMSPIEQSVIARWTVRPRLLGVPGVADVAVWGMRDQQLQVQVDPERLRDQNVTLNQVIKTAGNAQVVSPLSFLEASTPGTGGFIETPQQRLQVRHILEKIADPAELGKVPVEESKLRLSDVADIKVDHQPLIGDAIVGGGPGLLLVVEKFPGASTPEVTKGVEDALDTLRPGLTGVATDTSIFRPADYIDDALSNLGFALLAGGILMLLVLAALGFRWRSLLITVVTVPLSLVAAALMLELLGQGFNAIVLAGLAAAIAVVVDEAVVPSDHVMRRLNEHRLDGSGESIFTVIRESSAEVRRPLMYATGIVLLAIVPVAVLGGRPGAFFAPMALAYAVAVVVAMLVALTVTPGLAMMLAAKLGPAKSRDSVLSRRLLGRYQTMLGRVSGNRRSVVTVAVAFALIGLAFLPFLGTSLVPTFEDRNVLVRLEGQAGASNPRMTQLTTGISDQLKALPGVSNVAAHVGRAVGGDRVTNVSSSDIWITVARDADYGATMSAINDTVGRVKEVQGEAVTYTAQKMRDVGSLMNGNNEVKNDSLDVFTGLSKPIAVRVYGQDPDVLRREADRVKDVMSKVDGIADPQVDVPVVQPTIEIRVDLDKAQKFGLTPGDVRRAEATLVQGIQVGSVFEQQKVFDVIVQGAPGTRRTVEDIRNLLIDRPETGGHVRLGEVADVRVADTAAVIKRDAVSRRLDIQADVSGRSADDVAGDIEAQLARMEFPMEYHAEVLTKSTGDEIGTARFLGFAIAAAIAALLLLQAAFRSWRAALLVFSALPLALVGGLAVSWLSGTGLSLGSLLGLLAVFAWVTRASVLLVATIQSAERNADGAESTTALGRAGASERLAPTVRSAAAVGMLALPFALLGSGPGLELIQPMAVVLLGGLVTSLLVTLLLIPALYIQFAHPAERPVPADVDLRDRQPDTESDELGGSEPHELQPVGGAADERGTTP